MATQFRCGTELRRQLVREHATLNGIDYLEVFDQEAIAIGSPRQRTLLLRFVKAAPALEVENVEIGGGVRVTPVRVQWVERADGVPVPPATAAEKAFFEALPDKASIAIVRTDADGDFSTYRLRLKSAAGAPLADIDPALAELDFSFKVECPSGFDCRPDDTCAPKALEEPAIDYLAKDYASFRRLMLDRLAVVMPDWSERSAADVGVMLVEAMAYVADHLSYYQDAVATEAYLGTARSRVSVRRHARLLDYFVHEGCNARAWVCLEVTAGGDADGATLPAATKLVTGALGSPPTLDPASLDALLKAASPVVFETLHAFTPTAARNRIPFHTWSDEECCLPQGATRATLDDTAGAALAIGDVLVFEAVRDPASGTPAGADPAQRHVVRLTRADATTDPLDGRALVEIEWAAEDALPFPLCVSSREPDGDPVEVSIARGNVVLADHGLAIEQEALVPAAVPQTGAYRPHLARGGVTFAVAYDHALARGQPAARAAQQDPRAALPWVELSGGGESWRPRRDLLASDRSAAEFVVEADTDGTARLRFGDGVLGRRPAAAATFTARYRIGNGAAGNVGRESLRRLVTPLRDINRVWNPLPATGGIDAEPLAQVKLDAPQAFRVQERAVTEADYARVAALHPQVQGAAARFRWTGSWYTVFVTVDRKGGRDVDADFRDELRTHLERYRLAGYDLEIRPPQFVPLEIVMSVCVAPGYFRSDVKRALLRVLGSGEQSDGTRGFFHPDRFSFGDPVYLSQIYAAAESVAGVDYVEVTRFQRWGKPADGELDAGAVRAAPLEILQLANDPSFPENGKLELQVAGGL
ncbi:MAG: putative baseplate assembly protein [Burkholderiales bacterium]